MEDFLIFLRIGEIRGKMPSYFMDFYRKIHLSILDNNLINASYLAINSFFNEEEYWAEILT